MMVRYVCGIDPGIKGGITLIDLDTGLTRCWATPIIRGTPAKKGVRGGKIAAIKDEHDPVEMGKLLPSGIDPVVYIEQVGAMPGQGVTSMFRFGFGTGIWHGIIGARGWVPVLVRPQTWKAVFDLSDDKDASREIASKIAPTLSGFWPLVKHDGIAESFLIAHYGAIQLGRTNLTYQLEPEH